MSDKNEGAKIVTIGKWVVTADHDMLNKVVADAIKPRDEMHLGRWIKHDTWTSDEATLLLNGLDPDGTCLGPSNRWVKLPTGEIDVELNTVTMLDGRAFEPEFILGIVDYLRSENACSVDAQSVSAFKHWLWDAAESVVQLRKLLNSGTHQDNNPPVFYIEWAESKGLSGGWLEPWKRVFPATTNANASPLDKNKPATAIDPATKESKTIRKRCALIAELKPIWPSIEKDLSEASRSKNQLKEANIRRGYWLLEKVIQCGLADGKIIRTKASSLANDADDKSELAILLRQLLKA